MSNSDKVKKRLAALLSAKQDSPVRLPGTLGTVISGKRLVMVPGRERHVYVCINNNPGELVEALNQGNVGNDYGAHVTLELPLSSPGTYVVIGYDSGYTGFTSSTPSVSAHGRQHSFGPGHRGNDPVWIYKDQLMPMLVRPAGDSLPLGVTVEGDYYTWKGEAHWLTGTSIDLSSLVPEASLARYVVIAVDGDAGTLVTYTGTTYITAFPPSDLLDNLPMPPVETGFALKAVQLIGGQAQLTWDSMRIDLRTMIGSSYGSIPGVHGNTSHEHSYVYVPVSGSSTLYLNQLGGWTTPAGGGGGGGSGHDHGVARWNGAAGQTDFDLPDYAAVIEMVAVGGLLLDPLSISLNELGSVLTIDAALPAPATVQAAYVIRTLA